MLSRNLKVLRKINGFTQENLAEKLGVSRQSVAKWERDESDPDLGILVALTQLYDVTLDDLVNHDDKEEGIGIAPKGKHMLGTILIGEGNCIKLPEEAMDLFDLKIGNELLLLADEYEGMALVNKGVFMERMNDLYKGIDKRNE